MCSYTPGFDTHGLPLELKALAALNKPASELTPQQIRRAARKEAEKGIATQTGEFKSFAVMGEWDEPYRTMDWSYEKRQLEVVRDMVKKGGAIVSLHGHRLCLRYIAQRELTMFPHCAAAHRPHRLASPPNLVLAVVSHRARRSGTRVPRRPRLSLGLCLVSRERLGRRVQGRIGQIGDRASNDCEDRVGGVDHHGVDHSEQCGKLARTYIPA